MAATTQTDYIPREHMERAINQGGSVLHHGRSITRLEDLPDEAALSETEVARRSAQSAEEKLAALEALQAQLQQRNDELEDALREAKGEPPPTSEEEQPSGTAFTMSDPTPEKLEKAFRAKSVARLKEIATQEGIAFADDISKDDLIDLLLAKGSA